MNTSHISHAASAGYVIRMLTIADIMAITRLRDVVIAHLHDRDHYVRESHETDFLNRGLDSSGRGQMLGVTHGNALIAYGMVAYPTPFDTIDIGQFLSVVPTENLSDVAIMASTMVHPDYRCCGWHKLLLRSRENLAIANGKHIFVAEVSLSNWVTRCNLLRGGYFIEGCTDIDDQRRRHIFKRDVRQTRHFEPDEHAPDKVDQLAFERQRELIERGYVGVADSRPAHSIIYKKLGKQSNQGSWQ